MLQHDMIGLVTENVEQDFIEMFELREVPLGQLAIVLKNCSGYMLNHKWDIEKKVIDVTKNFYHMLALKYLEF